MAEYIICLVFYGTHLFLARSPLHTFLSLISVLALIPRDTHSPQGLFILGMLWHQFTGASHHTDSSFGSFIEISSSLPLTSGIFEGLPLIPCFLLIMPQTVVSRLASLDYIFSISAYVLLPSSGTLYRLSLFWWTGTLIDNSISGSPPYSWEQVGESKDLAIGQQRQIIFYTSYISWWGRRLFWRRTGYITSSTCCYQRRKNL